MTWVCEQVPRGDVSVGRNYLTVCPARLVRCDEVGALRKMYLRLQKQLMDIDVIRLLS